MSFVGKISFKNVVRIMNIWPPYLGAGIRVRLLNEKEKSIRVTMPLTKLNQNYVGVHFGGSLYSMVDPFYMLILIQKIGTQYIVWDKAAEIEFKSPGRGKVYAEFSISDEEVQKIKDDVEEFGKVEPIFTAKIFDEKDNSLVAEVSKRLWVRKRP